MKNTFKMKTGNTAFNYLIEQNLLKIHWAKKFICDFHLTQYAWKYLKNEKEGRDLEKLDEYAIISLEGLKVFSFGPIITDLKQWFSWTDLALWLWYQCYALQNCMTYVF